jgi:regulatory protein
VNCAWLAEFRSPQNGLLARWGNCFYSSLGAAIVRKFRKSAARKLDTEEDLRAAAIRALMRRAYSVSEMRKKLEGKAEDKSLVGPVLATLREKKLLDDARYAKEFARTRSSQRTQGRYRIVRELRGRGVADANIEAACDEAFAENSEADLVKKRLTRKLRLIRGPLDERKRASIYGSLLRSGFSSDLIRKAMREAAAEVTIVDEEPAEFRGEE